MSQCELEDLVSSNVNEHCIFPWWIMNLYQQVFTIPLNKGMLLGTVLFYEFPEYRHIEIETTVPDYTYLEFIHRAN